jgi:hypothetical protein
MMGTGVNDKNDVEIFAGDIILAGDKKSYYILFDQFKTPDDDSEPCMGFYFHNPRNGWNFPFAECDRVNVYEITGNIYE